MSTVRFLTLHSTHRPPRPDRISPVKDFVAAAVHLSLSLLLQIMQFPLLFVSGVGCLEVDAAAPAAGPGTTLGVLVRRLWGGCDAT